MGEDAERPENVFPTVEPPPSTLPAPSDPLVEPPAKPVDPGHIGGEIVLKGRTDPGEIRTIEVEEGER